MTTEKKSDETSSKNETSKNKAIFGPLGNYAVIAVIMVSIIVTTAIMLDKQLSSVDEQLATIENEVAQMNAGTAEPVTETTVTADIIEPAAKAVSEETTEVAAEAPATVEVQAVEVQAANVQATEIQTAETPSAEVLVAKETAATISSENQQENPAAAQFEMATVETSIEARRAQLKQENQARIAAFKQEQRQHMSELFARISKLEEQQLGRYKASQDKQVAYLRDQVVRQQQVIDALITRNKESFEMREARVLKGQSNREQTLDRI